MKGSWSKAECPIAEEFTLHAPEILPEIAEWDDPLCPEVDWDLSYVFKGNRGRILRCYAIDRDQTFAQLYRKLQAFVKKAGGTTGQTFPVAYD